MTEIQGSEITSRCAGVVDVIIGKYFDELLIVFNILTAFKPAAAKSCLTIMGMLKVRINLLRLSFLLRASHWSLYSSTIDVNILQPLLRMWSVIIAWNISRILHRRSSFFCIFSLNKHIFLLFHCYVALAFFTILSRALSLNLLW